jgi:xylan 1,4-beta-xylosidase
MAIYNEYEQDGETRAEYNFCYLDQVFDMYLGLGVNPFVELGFMPEKLASGTQTVFYWKGNVTPPADYAKWAALVTATVEHLDRAIWPGGGLYLAV